MPSDHVIKDEPGIRRRRAAGRRGSGDRPARAVRHYADGAAHRLRLHPPRRRRCRASTTPSPSTPSWRSPTGATAAGYLKAGGHYWNSGIFVFRARDLPRRAGPPRACDPGGRQAGARRRPRRTWASCGSTPMPSPRRPPSPSTTPSWSGPAPPPCCPIDIGWSDVGSWSSLWEIARQDADGNAVRGRGDPGGYLATATCTPSGRWSPPSASRTSSSSTPPMRCWSPTAPGRRTCRASSRACKQAGRKEHGAAPAQLPAVGLLRDAEHRSALPGQAPARQARRQALHADAPPSLRALGGRARHGQGDDRRRRSSWCARTSPSTSRPRNGTGSRTPARRRWS